MIIDKKNIKLFKRASVYFIIGGVSLIVALSWNNAFSNLIQKIFPNKSTNIIGYFLYSIILTLVFILLSITLIDQDDLNNFIYFKSNNKSDSDKKDQ
jgi:uncharacterized BrkB/YihY/UPF0761 family membrane protein